MAYFANGSEGDYYEAKYCARCVHHGSCPVLILHFLWNYEARGKDPDAEVKALALDTLWPCDGVHNADCTMFYEKEGGDE